MAEKVKNKKGFLTLMIERWELMLILRKDGCLGVCDSCGKEPHKGYYVAVLNQWLCKDCYDKFVERINRYKSDEGIEKRNFFRFCKLFDVEP